MRDQNKCGKGQKSESHNGWNNGRKPKWGERVKTCIFSVGREVEDIDSVPWREH
jgi:hypothetical protein